MAKEEDHTTGDEAEELLSRGLQGYLATGTEAGEIARVVAAAAAKSEDDRQARTP